ncbi:MAG: TolC family protein [Bacteroidales bacterium]|nr:TolC family protein [Bacteroidales bacterium]
MRKSNSVVDTRQEFASGTVQERDNAKSNSLNGSINLEWTVFDGFAMFVGYDKVKELSELGKLNTRMTLENLASRIATEYYNLIRQIQLINSLHYGLKLSKERLAIASEKYKIGSFSRLEYLQAQGDFNADSSRYLRQEETVNASKILLSKTLAYNLNIPKTWQDTILINKDLDIELLLKKTLDNNTGLLIANQSKLLSELDIKLIRSRYYPSLSLNSGFNYTNSESQSGFLLSNQTTGWTYGASLTFNIFNRFDNHRQIRNARIENENRELELQNLKQEITNELNQIWNVYTSSLRVLSLETSNLEWARENLDIAMTKYRLGSLAGIEMREIQKNYLDASSRYIEARYLAKIAEINLKQISGEIQDYF